MGRAMHDLRNNYQTDELLYPTCYLSLSRPSTGCIGLAGGIAWSGNGCRDLLTALSPLDLTLWVSKEANTPLGLCSTHGLSCSGGGRC